MNENFLRSVSKTGHDPLVLSWDGDKGNNDNTLNAGVGNRKEGQDYQASGKILAIPKVIVFRYRITFSGQTFKNIS